MLVLELYQFINNNYIFKPYNIASFIKTCKKGIILQTNNIILSIILLVNRACLIDTIISKNSGITHINNRIFVNTGFKNLTNGKKNNCNT